MTPRYIALSRLHIYRLGASTIEHATAIWSVPHLSGSVRMLRPQSALFPPTVPGDLDENCYTAERARDSHLYTVPYRTIFVTYPSCLTARVR